MSKLLDHCPNLEVSESLPNQILILFRLSQSLDIGYNHRRGPGYSHPRADDLFLYSRWPQLRTLSLTNLRCSPSHGLDAAATFLCAHLNIEVLHLDISDGGDARTQLVLPKDSLPRLRELRANNSIAASIVSCPCTTTASPRPLETLKGIRLTGGLSDQQLLESLKAGGNTVKRLEMLGWSDLEVIKKLAECVPTLVWLDLGKQLGTGVHKTLVSSSDRAATAAIHTNVIDWADVLSLLPDLGTFHGIKFFYEVSPLTLGTLYSSNTHTHSPDSLSSHLPASELSRVRKNENVASLLASKCTKLRRLDCWDEVGKAVFLVREGGEVRIQVKRVKI